jgi:acetyltransferase-like isoleucine patch superfamily enzyme
LFELNLTKFLWLNFIKRHNGWFLPYKKGYYNIHKTAKIIIDKKSIFSFNHGWKNEPFKGYLMMEEGSQLIVHGNFSIRPGGRILITKNATLELGSGYINNNVLIYCSQRIKIGNQATIALNFNIRDTDSHVILDQHYCSTKPIEIGDHVWIGTNVTILKGVKIESGAVIGANSLVTTNVSEKTLVAGVPAKVKRENIEWK